MRAASSLLAAFGAALQALWAYRRSTGSAATIESLCAQYVLLDETTRTRPSPERVELYRKMQHLHDRIVSDLGPSFGEHRLMISTSQV